MKEIAINSKTHGIHQIQVDDEDFEYLNQFKWRIQKTGNDFYARRDFRVDEKWKTFYIHRIVLGVVDPKVFIDHIDNNGKNDQKSNLRKVTNSQNQKNRRINNKGTLNSTSLYKGVSWHKRDSKWQAQIKVDGVATFIGLFDDEIEAAESYNKAAIKYFEKFARLNVIDEAVYA